MKLEWLSRIVLISVVGACSGDSGPRQVTVRTAVDPAFVAVSTDDGQTWSHPDPSGLRTYVFPVEDQFEFTAMIEFSGGQRWAQQLKARYADGDSWTLSGTSDTGAVSDENQPPPSIGGDYCLPPTLQPTDAVSGTLLQAGVVSFAGECMANPSTVPMTFRFDGAASPHDLIATTPIDSTTARLVISRAVDASSTVGNINLNTGIILVPLSVTLAGVDSGAPVTVASLLSTQTDSASLSALTYTDASHVQALVAPMGALNATDEQSVEIHSNRAADFDRAARVKVEDAEAMHLTMLDVPGVVVTSGVATSSQPLAADVGTVDLALMRNDSQPGTTTLQQATWTRGWLDAHPGAALTFDAAVDGYPGSWTLDTTAAHSWTFDVRSDSPSVTYSTSVRGTVQ